MAALCISTDLRKMLSSSFGDFEALASSIVTCSVPFYVLIVVTFMLEALHLDEKLMHHWEL